MSYKVTWDEIGPKPNVGQEACGLSYREALAAQIVLSRLIDNVHVTISKEDNYGQYQQI